MAFDKSTFVLWDAGYNTSAPTIHGHSTSDDISTVTGSGYFNSIAQLLKINDLIYTAASDSKRVVKVTAVTPDVEVESFIPPPI